MRMAQRADGGGLGREGERGARVARFGDMKGTALVTGGAGFIGTNTAHRLLSDGYRVIVLDNLSRPGVERNLEWLRSTHGSTVSFSLGDIRDRSAIREAVREADQVFHFAAQVAVTTSLEDPITDF